MSEQLQTTNKKSYVKYDKVFGNILEVALHDRLHVDESSSLLELLMPISMSFLKGEKKMSDFAVMTNDDGQLALLPKIYKRVSRNFWDMCLIGSEHSPFELVELTSNNFKIKLNSNVKIDDTTLLYVTNHNDPNCLQQTIKIQKDKFNKDGIMTIEVDYDDDYDVYVRNHAA